MTFKRLKLTVKSYIFGVFLFFILGIFPSSISFSQSTRSSYIGIRASIIADPCVSISEEMPYLGMFIDGVRTPILKRKFTSFSRKVLIDTTGQNVNLTEKLGDFDFRQPTFLKLSDYVEKRRQNNLNEMWRKSVVSGIGVETGRSGAGSAIRLEIPVEIKNKAFQKVFGTGTVALDVSGDITIKGGFRNEKQSQVKTTYNSGSDNSFKMEQTQRFRVDGKIGDKVTIGVDQDSERAFEFENNLHLNYKGHPDEIIKSIEAGNTSLSLSGTRFVGGSSQGLFGIKVTAEIGNLELQAIASQEKGEKKKLSLSGGASESEKRIEDYNYLRNVYFFIDDYYRLNFLNKDASGNPTYDPSKVLSKFEFYKSGRNYNTMYAESVKGFAIAPTADQQDWATIRLEQNDDEDANHYSGYFIRLEKEDYVFDEQMGYVRLKSPLNSEEVLAVAFRDTSGHEMGDVYFDPETDENIVLRMIKGKNPQPSNRSWYLEWKNVYSLGASNIPRDGFDLKILYKPASGDPIETIDTPEGKKTWLQVFGLDRVNEAGIKTPDNIIDDNQNIINFALGELYFPDLTPFNPQLEEVKKLLPEDNWASALYDTTVQTVINEASQFYIQYTSKTRSSEYRLGMNVIENSEEVLLNGRTLNRGTDYTIDYFTGTLRLLTADATAANAQIEISYESNQLFQIDKKTMMGAYAKYNLWDDSYISGVFTYLNERTLDQKVRVGKGPMRNMIWDLSSKLTFTPFFLTKAANYLPFVDTRAESKINFEGEVAQILPNPNTRNNESTGDNDGVAYIDDFEASKQVTPIPITRRSWSYSSYPKSELYEGKNDITLEHRGKLIYDNPVVQTSMKEIWPERDISGDVAKSVATLMLQFTPADTVDDVRSSWNGIQKALSSGYSDQTEAKYLEVWVKIPESQRHTTGTLHIDMGQISEDVIPNGEYDTEDKEVNSIRNSILDDGEDVGLDGMANNSPIAQKYGGDFWDINRNEKRDYGEPFSNDDYSYSQEQNRNYNFLNVNGTEGNADDAGGRIPDTEDLNGNGDVDLRNDYFEYTFSLRSDHPDTAFISGSSGSYGWRQYRIPLNAPEPTKTVIGSPNFSQIEYIRIWMDGFEKIDRNSYYTIQIAEVNLVGSEWKEMGIASPEFPEEYEITQDSVIAVTVINTHDNPEYAAGLAPPGVQGVVDRVTQVQQREQSLVIKVNNLNPGYNGTIIKTFYEAQDYINYNTLKMFVYGKDDFGQHITNDSTRIEFFLRLGADKNNYYEIRRPVFPGWTKNNIEIDLVKLSQVKYTGTLVEDENSTVTVRVDTIDGHFITVKGNPALRNIRQLVMGVKNLGQDELGDKANDLMPFVGQVWVNELRLSNVKKDKGMAYRAKMDFSLADLARFSGEMEKKDADFHDIQTRFGDGNNKLSGRFTTSFNVDKFLPSQLGIALPVSINYSRSESTPKYIPGTDVQISDSLPDSTIEKTQTISEQRGMSVSFRINSRSQNFVVKHLLSKFSANYSQNLGHSRSSTTKAADTKNESGSMNWGVNFSNNNYIRPFSWLGKGRLVTRIAEMKLYYTPRTINTKISGTRSKNNTLLRSGIETENSSFNVSRNVSGTMDVTESVQVDISRSYVNDLRDVDTDTLKEQLKQFKMGLLTSVDQNFGVKYRPQLFSWMTSNFSYSTTYKFNFNRQQSVRPRSATQSINYMASGSVKLGTLFSSIYRPSRGGQRRSTSRRQAPGAKSKQSQQTDNNSGGGFSVLGIFSGFFNIFDPFSISYSERTQMSAYDLAGVPTTAFQFGFSKDTGVPSEIYEGNTSGKKNSESQSTSLQVSSGFSLSRNVKLSLKYDNSASENSSSTTTSGQTSESWLKFGEDVSMPFPDWTVRVSGMEKLPFLNKYMSRVSFDHNYSGKISGNYDVDAGVKTPTKEATDISFRPLIGLTFSWKNGISMAVKYNSTERTTYTLKGGSGGQKNTSTDLSISARYTKRGNFRIPLPFFNKRLKNSVDISLTFNMGDNITYKNRKDEDFVVTSETSKWFLKPNMSYSFSDRVKGGAYFEIGKTSNKLVGDSSYKELGIDVNIAIRGN